MLLFCLPQCSSPWVSMASEVSGASVTSTCHPHLPLPLTRVTSSFPSSHILISLFLHFICTALCEGCPLHSMLVYVCLYRCHMVLIPELGKDRAQKEMVQIRLLDEQVRMQNTGKEVQTEFNSTLERSDTMTQLRLFL